MPLRGSQGGRDRLILTQGLLCAAAGLSERETQVLSMATFQQEGPGHKAFL